MILSRLRYCLLLILWGIVYAVPSCLAAPSELGDAIERGDLEAVAAIVARDPATLQKAVDGSLPLVQAVFGNEVQIAQLMLEQGADVNQRLLSNYPSAIYYAQSGEMAKLLISHGAKLDVRASSGLTPLQHAAQGHLFQVVDVLISSGMKWDLESAVRMKRADVVASLLKDEAIMEKALNETLWIAADDGSVEIVQLLLEHGANPNYAPPVGNAYGPFTSLTGAVTDQHFDAMQLLLKNGADANVGGVDAKHLLIYAIVNLEERYSRALLEHGADVREVTNPGTNDNSPLHVAAALGGEKQIIRLSGWNASDRPIQERIDVVAKVKCLLDHGADVNSTTQSRATPLLAAALAENTQLCQLLIAAGAQLDLSSACLLGDKEAVSVLLKKDPKLIEERRLGVPPLHYALLGRNVAIVQLLIQQGANVNEDVLMPRYEEFDGFFANMDRKDARKTPLMLAAFDGNLEMSKLLVESGADVDPRRSVSELSPLEFAAYANHLDVVKLLAQHDAHVTLEQLVSLLQLPYVRMDAQVLEELVSTNNMKLDSDLGRELLSSLIDSENFDAAEYALSHGAPINLFSAIVLGRIDDVRVWLDKNPKSLEAEIPGTSRETPLSLAVQYGRLEIVKELVIRISHRESPRWGNYQSHLEQAAKGGSLEILQFLIGFAKDHKEIRVDLQALLHSAAEGAQPDVLRYLLRQGVSIEGCENSASDPFSTGYKMTPLFRIGLSSSTPRARQEKPEYLKRELETAQQFIDAGVAVSAHDRFGRTALHMMARFGPPELVELLISAGADVNARTWQNETPLSFVSYGQLQDSPAQQAKREIIRRHGGVE